MLLSNLGLTRASETYASLFHSSPGLHTIVAVPLCHNTGFVDQLGHALVAGGSIEAHRRFRADTIAEALQTGACSYFIGVPTMYHRIVEHLTGAVPSDLAPWLAFGGAPMPSKLIVQLQHLFPRAQLANCYGLSEATSITHINFVTPDATATDVGVAVSGHHRPHLAVRRTAGPIADDHARLLPRSDGDGRKVRGRVAAHRRSGVTR